MSSLDAIIGEMVSATSIEKAMAAAMAIANSVNRRPIWPCMNVIGTNTAMSTKRGGDDGEADLARAAVGGDERRFAFFLDPAVDVFQHDDGVIDHKTDGHDEGEQRQHVDRQAERIEHREGRDQRDRHGHGGDQGRLDRAEEHEDHADDEQQRRCRAS